MNPNPVPETTIPPTVKVSENPNRMIVRHTGLNRKVRRGEARIVRLYPNGHPRKNLARKWLNGSLANVPLRKAVINGVPTLMPEKVYWQLVAMYSKVETPASSDKVQNA